MEIKFDPAQIYYLLGGLAFLLTGAWQINTTISKKFKEMDSANERRNQDLMKTIENLRQYIDSEFVRKDVYASDMRRLEDRLTNGHYRAKE